MTVDAQRFALRRHPQGESTADDFQLETVRLANPGPGEVVVRVQYLSLDRYVRGRISGVASYAEPTPLGSPPPGDAVGVVEASNDDSICPGDAVVADIGSQTYGVVAADRVRKLDPAFAPVTTALGVLGMPGLTAYIGLITLSDLEPGETVVVAAATGPVGPPVGQHPKLKGARAVGIAGGRAKADFRVSRLAFDAAVDHRSPTFVDELAAAAPTGVDVYFESVGGKVFGAVFPLLTDHARIPVCGLISGYNDTLPAPLPGSLMTSVLSKRLTIHGFIVRDYWNHFDSFLEVVGAGNSRRQDPLPRGHRRRIRQHTRCVRRPTPRREFGHSLFTSRTDLTGKSHGSRRAGAQDRSVRVVRGRAATSQY
jgi:NADPH-dependent curcumin reductase